MDPLYEILAPHLDTNTSPPSATSPQTNTYLARLSTLSLPALTTTEPASLLQTANSHLRNLQALSKRSHKAVIASSEHLAHLRDLLPNFSNQTSELSDGVPALESAASDFAKKYDRSSSIDNAVLEQRKRALLLARNVDRVGDVLELPSLLASTVSAAQAASISTAAGSSATSYASALDLHAHIKRLSGLYPHSELVRGVARQAEAEIENLAGILVAALQSPVLKLAAAMRTVGYLRRVAPELTEEGMSATKPAALSTKSFDFSNTQKQNDGALGALFLLCRLHTMHTMLAALEPLRDLADQDTTQRHRTASATNKAAPSSAPQTGTQTERYLKRYIEIFREQSFNIVSMYRSIFPSGLPTSDEPSEKSPVEDQLLPLPAPVSSFALHLVDLMMATLRTYLPNVSDKSSRESLLTQVLYCAGSFGRLGADFGMAIALLEDDLDEDEEEPEWAAVMKKHRVQASRLEVLARGVGAGRKAGTEVVSPGAAVGAG